MTNQTNFIAFRVVDAWTFRVVVSRSLKSGGAIDKSDPNCHISHRHLPAISHSQFRIVFSHSNRIKKVIIIQIVAFGVKDLLAIFWLKTRFQTGLWIEGFPLTIFW